MEKWMMKNVKAPINEMSRELNVSPIVAKLLVNRNVKSIKEARDFLHPDLKNLNDPFKMKDMDKAVDIISKSILNDELIEIIGDYDVDGVVSTYILYSSICELGGNVTYAIPHRIIDGYGINKNMVLRAYEKGVKLIITCDNGISAFDAIDYARDLGIKVIITDHHEINLTPDKEEILPNAIAILNPKRESCEYPFKKLCGAGVALKLSESLYIHYNKKGFEKYIEFAAIATVCDVVDLIGENRII
ncbi:MAG: DHH family phosphoesterase, partial [Oscillospiraceae bacterium]|nr:DHH family phosphoesterase [Oscillospiraceae bacterium]